MRAGCQRHSCPQQGQRWWVVPTASADRSRREGQPEPLANAGLVPSKLEGPERPRMGAGSRLQWARFLASFAARPILPPPTHGYHSFNKSLALRPPILATSQEL